MLLRVLAGSISALAFVIGLSGGSACAAEHKEEKPIFKAHLHPKDGKPEEKKFDMSKPQDKQALLKHIEEGEVTALVEDKPPELLNIRWDLGLWTIVVFVLLFFILKKAAWGPMLEGLHKREQSIRGAIEDAQRAKDEAQRLRDQFQQELDKSHETVRGILDEARRDAQHTTDEMVAKARTEIQAERDRLRREIETAQEQALQEIWNQTAHLAAMVSTKAIRRQLTADDHRRLVDDALTELNQRGDEWRKQLASTMG